MFSNFFFRKWCRLWDNVEKYGGARGATKDVTTWRIRVAGWISKATCTHAHAHTLGHSRARLRTHTQRNKQTCNTYYFFMATVVTWTRLNVTLYVHCLSYFFQCYVFRPIFIFRCPLKIFENQGKMLVFVGSLKYYRIYISNKIIFLIIYHAFSWLCQSLYRFQDGSLECQNESWKFKTTTEWMPLNWHK